ncbi:MAG TPA: SHOCT domain-containing protein [Verrucomicrobiae bacterium]|nr:SHOCT domain-containing protein [Verrucomicrobiae bacterium]
MKQKLSKWPLLLATASVMGCLLSGCAWQLGADTTGTTIIRPTKGKELIDLKKARDQGAITEDEYQAQRKNIMEQ